MWRGPSATGRWRSPSARCRSSGSAARSGRLVLESVRDDGPSITFDPILNALPRLHLVRRRSALREWAYTGSRTGRRAEPASLCRRPYYAADA